jgi:hypothetical protein
VRTDRAKVKRGRKPTDKSRAVEIRTKLLAWNQTPKSQRVSLRALALALGTSHQLLCFYLRSLGRWQAKDYRRRARAIRELAAEEDREMTPWEESQAKALERESLRYLLDSALASAYRRYEAEFRTKNTASLTRNELRFLNVLARHNVPFAQKLLMRRNNLPAKPAMHAKSFK